jgi:hypothetical protein
MHAEDGRDLDEAARSVVAAARQAARELGHERCGTEHLLLGATRRPDLDEHDVCKLFGLEHPLVEMLVEHIGASRRVRGPLPDPLPLSTRATQALATTRADGTGPTGWPELLHGALSDDASGACEIVRRLGKDLNWLRVALRQQTRHLTPQEAQEEADQLDAMARARHPPWIGPHPGDRRVHLALPEPTDDHGAVRLAEHGGTTARIANLFAASEGFGFTVMVAGPVWDHQLTFEPDNARRASAGRDDDVLVTIEFADGSRVDNTDRHTSGYATADPPAGRVLAVVEQGGSRSNTHAAAECELWSWPLPPPGPVTIDVTWAHRSLHGRLVLSGDELLAAAARAHDGRGDFELVASWLPPDFVLQRSGDAGASMHVVAFPTDGAPVETRPPIPIVFSATWVGRPSVLGEGRLDFARLTVTATRSTMPAIAPPGGTVEQIGPRTITHHAGEPHGALWDEDGLQVRVFGHGVTSDQFRQFLAGLRRPT